jgi:hypothetical protein
VPPLRHSTARFGREIFFENRGAKSRLQRTAYVSFGRAREKEEAKKESCAWEKATLRVNDMDYRPTRYGERKMATETQREAKKRFFFFSLIYVCGASMAFI